MLFFFFFVFLYPQCAHYLKALQDKKKVGPLFQNVEEEPPVKINWTLIVSIIVIMSYRMWATGTGKIIREDVFGWSSTVGMEEILDPTMSSVL